MRNWRPKSTAVSIGLSLLLVAVVVLSRDGGKKLKSVSNGPGPRPAHATHLERSGANRAQSHSGGRRSSAELADRLASGLSPLREEPDALQQDRTLTALANEIARADILPALESLKELEPSPFKDDLSLRLIRRLAETNPRAAAEWTEGISGEELRWAALADIAVIWAVQDSVEAVEWVQGWPHGSDRSRALLNVGFELARTDPLRAITIAADAPPDGARNDLVTHAAGLWAATSPQAAVDWAKSVPDQELRERLLAEVVTTWGNSDPSGAATIALQAMSPGRQQDDAIIGIVKRWVQDKPEVVASWVVRFPDGDLRTNALEEVVKLWADRDSAQVETWLNELAPGTCRDLALATFAGKFAAAFPAHAVKLASGIGDPTVRLLELERLGGTWLAQDADSARAWISQAALPGATKARLLASIGR